MYGRDQPKPLLGVSDQPITKAAEDSLGLEREAQALADFIAGCVTPLTIAIQGDWGSGKTSLLRLIEERLDPKVNGKPREGPRPVEVIRFETWQYAQFGGGPMLPLSLLSMLAQRLAPPGRLSEVTGVIKRFARPVVGFALEKATMGFVEADQVGKLGAEEVDYAQQCDRLRQALHDIVAKKTEKGGAERIVVLIDDLDRIDPPLAIDILQTIKMFLDLEHCVFVLALDFEVVRLGVEQKYGIKDARKARAFFDKIIQLPFQVPVAKYDTGGFVLEMIERVGVPGFGHAQVDTLMLLADSSISFNPRAIKRAVNALYLTNLIARDKLARLDRVRGVATVALFGLLCMQARFPEAYSWLLAQQDTQSAMRAFAGAKEGEADELLNELKLGDEVDRAHFPLFARAFAEAVGELWSGDTGPLEVVLGITRATSVGEKNLAYRPSAEMREDNAAIMGEVLADVRARLPGAAVDQRKDGGWIYVTAEVRPSVWLTIEHSTTWLGVLIEGAPAELDAVATLLEGTHREKPNELHVWSAPGITRTRPAWKRRDLLLREATPRFADAWRRLTDPAHAA